MLLNRRDGETGVDATAEQPREADCMASRPPPETRERHVYAPPAGQRWVGLLGTGAVYAVMLAGFLLTVRHHVAPAPPPAPLVVDLLPLASPSIEEKQVKPAPEEKQEKQEPEPPKIARPELVPMPIAASPSPRLHP